MEKVGTIRGYDLYIGSEPDGKKFYNAVPKGMRPPDGGYDLSFIAHVKNINPLAWTTPKEALKGNEEYSPLKQT